MRNELQTRLILVEGLPSTGKSTNSGVLLSQLERNGYQARWIHEVARPHPTLFFYEANLTHREYGDFLLRYPHVKDIMERIKVERKHSIGIDLLEIEWTYMREVGQEAYDFLKQYDVWNFSLDDYMKAALEKWASFAENQMQRPDEVILLDSSIFQFQIYTFLLANAAFDQLDDFLRKIYELIAKLHPTLLYFYRENVEDTIAYLEQDRGSNFLESIWARDQHQPYYQGRPCGAEGYKVFLRDYHEWAMKLFAAFPHDKMAVEITNGDWERYTDELFARFNLKYIHPAETAIENGTYINYTLDQQITIIGDRLITPNGSSKRLLPKTKDSFYLHDLPVVIRFAEDRLLIEGEQICERWTTQGTIFDKRSS